MHCPAISVGAPCIRRVVLWPYARLLGRSVSMRGPYAFAESANRCARAKAFVNSTSRADQTPQPGNVSVKVAVEKAGPSASPAP